jgi:hypothetical protein
MPETEFELYLSLLSRFLRLKPAQRGEIADELRDHLEARLEELSAQGLSREQAIRAALDEFGDAAELATHFTKIARTRRRRLIMRCTAGSIAAMGLVILMTWAFAPDHAPIQPPPAAMAQFGAPDGAGGGDAAAGAAPATKQRATAFVTSDESRNLVEGKLAKRIKLDFLDVPLQDACEFISEQIQIDILIDRTATQDEGIALDTPITLNVRHSDVTARTALDLILEPHHLSYTIRDGLIMITTAVQANEIQVYNCSDLIASHAGHASGEGGYAGAGAMMGGMDAGMGAPGMGMMAGGMPGMGGGGMEIACTSSRNLAEVITTTIDPNSWQTTGGTGSITEYNGLLVIKASQTVHLKVRQLLEMMRLAKQMGPPRSHAAISGEMGMGGSGFVPSGLGGGRRAR